MKKKALSLALAVLMMVSVTLTGCQKKEAPAPADKVAVALFNMILRDDASYAVELFGYADEAEAREDMGLGENLYNELADQLVSMFEQMQITVTNEDAQAFVNAFLAMFKNVTITAVVKESDEKAGTAVVTCTVDTFGSDAIVDAISQATAGVMSDEALISGGDENALYSALIQKTAEAISGLTPTEETKDFDVNFVLEEHTINGKERQVWLPEDANAFGEAISNSALGM